MPVRKASQIAADIRRRIAEGEWKPGDRLADERAIASTYGVARNTVRNALAELEQAGLIERHVGRGTMVRENPGTDNLDILERFLDASPIDILNLRIYIEPATAAGATRNASDQELNDIVTAARQAEMATDLEAYETWDNEFHRRIYAAARNTFLFDFFRMLSIIRHQAPMMEIRRRSFNEQRRQIYNREHEAIVAAMRAWDGEAAAAAMRSHLLTRRAFYFGQ